MVLFLALLILAPTHCLGFFWPHVDVTLRGSKDTNAQTAEPLEWPDDILTKNEVRSLHLNYDALQSYSRKPDCFKNAANSIRTQCADLDMDEQERVNAAISMTLCEIATAKHHSFPMECQPYSFEYFTWRSATPSKVQGECVDALSRSAQFWSSYSGYLREVPQLCHAFRRWNDIDLARDIYRNATMDQISIIHSLANREKKITKYTDKWSEISVGMERTANKIRVLSEKHHITTDKYTLRLEGQMSDALEKFLGIVQDTLTRKREMETESASQLGIMLNDAVVSHSNKLTKLVEIFHHLLSSRLNHLASVEEVRYQQRDHSFSALEERWGGLGLQFDSMKQSLVVLSDQSTELSRELGISIQASRDIRDLTTNAQVASSGLVSTLALLTETANTGLETINGSAHLIGRQLQVHIDKAEGRNSDLWILWFFKMAGSVAFGAESDVFEMFNEHHTSLHVLLSILGFGWATFRTCFSIVSTVSVLLFLATRRMVIRILAHIFSSISTSSVLPLAPNSSKTKAQNVLFVPELPTHALNYPYSRRVSRIPDRSWNP